jgi:putative membrane protein
MKTSNLGFLVAAALLAAAATPAQTPAPPPATGDPGGASTPHQRETTGAKTSEAPTNESPEAAAASSPHQKAAASKGVSESELRMAQQDGAVPATFVKKAALDGMTEVELGKVAASKAQNADVRKYGERMVQDHGKANAELASIAKDKNLDVPKALDSEHQAIVQMLSAKSGAAFDSAYAEHMNMDHAKAIALFEGASKSTDSELAAFAKETLPTLKQHKEMAEALPKMRSADAADTKKK